MGGIVSPAPEGCLVGIHGYNGSSWVKLAVDSSGYLRIVASSLPLPSGAATESSLLAILSAITKNNIDIWVDTYAEQLTGSGSSGQIAIFGTQVAAGKRLVITNMFATISAGSSTDLNLCCVIDGVNTVMYRLASPAVNAPVQWSGRAVLDAGDRVRCNANNVGSSTSVTFHVCGYYMSTT